MEALAKCCAGLDVHKALVVCTLLKESPTGEIVKETREYSTFRVELERLAKWLKDAEVELVVG